MRYLPAVLLIAATLISPTLLSRPALAEGPEASPPPRAFREITPEQTRAIHRGLGHLRRIQSRAGSWRADQYTGAVTALCGLAFLANGSTPVSGEDQEVLRKALGFVLSQQRRTGMLAGPQEDRPMYSHGYSLLFLAECYGMSGRDPTVKEAIERAVHVVEHSQSAYGGWYYAPEDKTDEGSVTITQIQGLRAARNAGLYVPKAVIDRAVRYVEQSQDKEGGIKYTVRSGRSTPSLTAAGLSVLFNAGEYQSEHVDRAATYLRKNLDIEGEDHFEYTHLYAVQAYFQLGGTDWKTYYPRARAEVLRRRNADGVWSSTYGDAYATSISVIVLSLPYRYLPSFAR